MIEEDVVAWLKTKPLVNNIINGRIHPLQLPQDPSLDALTYQRISGVREESQEGPSGLAHPRLQFDCWSKTYPGAKRLAEALRLTIDGFTGSMNGRRVFRCKVENDLDQKDDFAERYRVTVDVTVWHREEVTSG